MVGFASEADLLQSPNLKLRDPPDNDLSFVDSLLDFESIERWFSETEVKNANGSDPFERGSKLGCGIEEELGKVSLVGRSEEAAAEDCLVVSEESKTRVESGVSVEEDGKGNVATEAGRECGIEEGDGGGEEGGDEVAWSDVEIFDEEEDVINGPIRSKNEIEELPPVPPVHANLESHHQMLPVGVILSVVGTKIIVEGVEKHNPLDEGSILWITESRSPLGLVDEIFGPVINPYYMVRYNTESEIPAGIQVGTPVSFVQEFADHVLNNNKDLYRKGYDASGANDEEISDESEFSDDEKEAEYKRQQKMAKRGINDQNAENKKNNRKRDKNRTAPWSTDQHHEQSAPARRYGPSSGTTPESLVRRPSSGQFSGAGVRPNGMLCQPQQAPFPNAFPNNNNMPFFPQYPHQMSMLGGIPFHQQQQQQANAFAGLMASQWGFNQTPFGIGFQGQPTPGQPMHAYGIAPQGQLGSNQFAFGMGENGFNANAFGLGQPGQHGFNRNGCALVQPGHHGYNNNTFPSVTQSQSPNPILGQNMPQPGNPASADDSSQQYDWRTSDSRGRRPYRRGGHQFARGGGRSSS